MSGWVDVGPAGEPREGESREVEAGGREVALFHLGGTWYALDAFCSHEECPLADGEVQTDTGRVVCYCHGAEFEIATGRVVLGPAEEDVATYPVRVAGDRLEVEVDA